MARTVGVINLFGRERDDPFALRDQKLLSAIASQIGAALENNRLIQESLAQERMSHEMELAHHLQMKLLKSPEAFDRADVAARVASAEQVGGDFFHLFKLPKEKIGIMIGDVSTHGFPAALIMALSMSAASIYALESSDPSVVLRNIDDALSDELESTEMFLSLCYVVIDPVAGELQYSNAATLMRSSSVRGVSRNACSRPTHRWASPGPTPMSGAGREWKPGDLLLLFTDGLSDSLATAVPRSGEAAVLEAVMAQGTASPAHIVDTLFELAGAATPYIPADDRTAIVLRTFSCPAPGANASPMRAKKSLGQNFLVDPNLQRKIVEALNPTPADTVLEIGPRQRRLDSPPLGPGGPTRSGRVGRRTRRGARGRVGWPARCGHQT